jgi:peptidoglycan hydrolase-like protein with peptidoglycan-binding domain
MASTYYTIGSKGDDVKKLQQALTSAGYSVGSSGADGIYGKDTAAAVKAYQKANNLTADGIIGTQTLGSLYKPVATASSNVITPVKTDTSTYNPQTGKGTFDDGTQYEKFTYENGMPTNVGTGAKLGSLTGQTDLTGINDIKTQADTTSTATTPSALDVLNSKIDTILNKYLDYDINSAYDVTTDPQYASLKQQYENAGSAAYNNQMGRLAAMTGGRPSTAAVGTASQAQNNYAQEFSGTVLPGLISNEQTRRQQAYSNLASQLEELQGVVSTRYNQYRDTVSDTGQLASGKYTQAGQINQQAIQSNEEAELTNRASILAAANYDNIQAYINTLDPNDPLVPYLQAERQKKIDAQNAAQATAEEKAAATKTAAEQTTYERSVEQQELASKLKYTNAQIANMAADNARAWATVNESNGTKAEQKARDTQYNTEFKNMMSAADPTAYLESVKANLYPEVYSSLKKIEKGEKTYSYVEDPEYATELEDAIADPQGWLEIYKSNRQAFYDTYTSEGAQKIADVAQAQIDENVSSSMAAKYKEYYTLAETDFRAFKKKMKSNEKAIIDEVGIDNYEKLKEMLQ